MLKCVLCFKCSFVCLCRMLCSAREREGEREKKVCFLATCVDLRLQLLHGRQIKYLLRFGFMFCQNSVKIDQLLRGRPGSDRPTCLFTAEQKSVEDINLNISHAWGTPHKENKLAHPCISWGRYMKPQIGGAVLVSVSGYRLGRRNVGRLQVHRQ